MKALFKRGYGTRVAGYPAVVAADYFSLDHLGAAILHWEEAGQPHGALLEFYTPQNEAARDIWAAAKAAQALFEPSFEDFQKEMDRRISAALLSSQRIPYTNVGVDLIQQQVMAVIKATPGVIAVEVSATRAGFEAEVEVESEFEPLKKLL